MPVWDNWRNGMLLTSSISWRARLVAASRPRVATVFEFAVSIVANVPSAPTTSTRAAIITSTSVNPRWHATRPASIGESVGNSPVRLYLISGIPALGRRRTGKATRRARGPASRLSRCRLLGNGWGYQLPLLGQAPFPVVTQVRVTAPVAGALVIVNVLPDADTAAIPYPSLVFGV